MYESPLIKMHQQIKKREGNSCLSMLIINQNLEKKGGKVKSEHAHKRHQHLKKRGKVMSEHAHKGTSIWKKRERELMSGHAHKRHKRLESKERFKICTKHVHYCK